MSRSHHQPPGYLPPHRAAAVTSRLMGVVRDLAGRPLNGAAVTLLPQDVTALTGPDGGFAFLLPAGRITLHVAAARHVPMVVERIDLVPGGSWRRDVVLAAQPTPAQASPRHPASPRSSIA